MAATVKTPAAQHKARLADVMDWFRQSDWRPDSNYDYDAFVSRAMTEFGMRKDRARILVAKAARRMRGETVSMGGRGDRRANFNVKLDVPCVIELKSLDASIYIETPAALLNGDGKALEAQFKMRNALGEMVDTILTLRVRESDD